MNVINLSSTPQSDMPIAGFFACGLLGMIVWIDRIRMDKDSAFSMVFAMLVACSLALAAVMKASVIGSCRIGSDLRACGFANHFFNRNRMH